MGDIESWRGFVLNSLAAKEIPAEFNERIHGVRSEKRYIGMQNPQKKNIKLTYLGRGLLVSRARGCSGAGNRRLFDFSKAIFQRLIWLLVVFKK